jgi:hypothetical protein
MKNIKDSINEKIDEQTANLKKLKDKAIEKISETKNFIKESKELAEEKIEEATDQLKDTKDKTLEVFKNKNFVPNIKAIILEQVFPQLKIENLTKMVLENKIDIVFGTAYEFFPAPVRIVITKEKFVSYCHKNKSEILSETIKKELEKLPEKRSITTELEKLKQLLDAEVLTKDEFETLKKRTIEKE